MRAFVLMKALPPTTGHAQLIEFARTLGNRVTVIIDARPDEPLIDERLDTLEAHFSNLEVDFRLLTQDLPEESECFRELWRGILIGAGAQPGDYLVTSEPYGKWLARLTEMTWMPYDIAREMNPTRASSIREDLIGTWSQILPGFRPHLQTRITIFGAESCGKTTLSRDLAKKLGATYLLEWARSYLENDENVINVRTMTNIWHGQAALQRQEFLDSPIIIQDTDLHSTLGYWNYWSSHLDSFEWFAVPRLEDGPPQALKDEARELSSDLYIITPSNIPFEPDPLRYGGDKREITDDYWVNYLNWLSARGNNVNYRVLKSVSRAARLDEAAELVLERVTKKQALIAYDRRF